jgi:AraC-like DNA-binding protein
MDMSRVYTSLSFSAGMRQSRFVAFVVKMYDQAMLQMAKPVVGERARLDIAAALQEFLGTGSISRVEVAQDTADPPLMAYLTHFPRLTVVLHGKHKILMARDGKAVSAQLVAGTALYIPANCWNLPDWSQPVSDLTLLFGKRHTGVSLVNHPFNGVNASPRILKASLHRDSMDLLRHLARSFVAGVNLVRELEHDGQSPAAGGLVCSVATTALHATLCLLTATASSPVHRAQRMYDSMRLYVQENSHLPISRDSVAAHFGLTPNHVSRLFRDNGDLGFNETLNLARVDRAKSMLGQYGTPLKEIAQHCGFASTAYFCRTFKRITCCTPSEYRLRRRD